MKTLFLIFILTSVSLLGCKEKGEATPKVKKENVPVFIIDAGKPAGSLRLMVKPLCYDDLNAALIQIKRGGC